MNKWEENINTIKEIYPGHFQIILDFATTKILPFILRDDYQYVWVHDHQVRKYFTWTSHELPVFENHPNIKVLARDMRYDFIMNTADFRSYLDKLSSGITLIQLNKLPKEYMDPSRIKGKKLYDLLLRDGDYLFIIDLPSATDYGTLVSSNKNYLQELIDCTEINWKYLP